MKEHGFDAAELDRFRDVQRLAYACATDVAGDLREGVTEKEAARRMVDWMTAAGVSTYFHRPFAWFGARTAFRGIRHGLDFFPTEQRLSPGMPFLLDVAPIVDGHVADIGYSASLGTNRVQEHMREDLLACRALLLERVRARQSFRRIYEDLDRWIARHGYESAHRVYPERVLAHRVVRLDADRVSRTHVLGFGLDQYRWLIPRSLRARLSPERVASPLWNDGPESDHPPLPGLWAVEPHLAFGDVGAKWEEILVITEDDAYWLDDHVPHVREGRARGWISGPAASAELRA
jgi:Xaa-Pro aminopeptidase